MKRVLISAVCVIVMSNITLGSILYYDIDFSSPEHTVGLAPATGGGISTPSRISFGSPIVSESLGSLLDQPLVFNSLGNDQSFYYDQIELNMDSGRGFYYTSFDVTTQNLIGSRNGFKLLYDLPWVHNITFKNNGIINIFDRINVSYQDNQAMHFEVLMDISQDYAKVYIDNNLVYDDELLLHLNRNDPEDYYLRSLRFSHGLVLGIDPIDTSSFVGLDNIFVANYVPVPEPGTVLLFGFGGLILRRRKA